MIILVEPCPSLPGQLDSEKNDNVVGLVWVILLLSFILCLPFYLHQLKQIPSEMEVAPRYKLLSLLTLFTFTLFTQFSLLTCCFH